MPVTSPSQRLKVKPEAGSATNVTCVPASYTPPGGLSTTTPSPSVSTFNVSWPANAARICLSESIVMVTGEDVPLKSPLQPINAPFAPGRAAKVTSVPARYTALLSVPDTGGGFKVTLPEPVVSIDKVNSAINCAITLLLRSITRVCGLVSPAKSPLQSLKTLSGPGTAVTVTSVPSLYKPFTGGGSSEITPRPVASVAKVYWRVKVTETFLLVSMVNTWGFPRPLKSPLQPLKMLPESAIAVTVTSVSA